MKNLSIEEMKTTQGGLSGLEVFGIIAGAVTLYEFGYQYTKRRFENAKHYNEVYNLSSINYYLFLYYI